MARTPRKHAPSSKQHPHSLRCSPWGHRALCLISMSPMALWEADRAPWARLVCKPYSFPVPVTNSRQLKRVGCDSSRTRLGDSSPRHGDRPTWRRARARVTRANFPSNVERCGEDQYFAIQPSEGQRYSSPSANHRVWPLTEGGGGRVILLEVPQLLDEAVNHTHRIKAVQPGQHLTLCPLYSGGQGF